MQEYIIDNKNRFTVPQLIDRSDVLIVKAYWGAPVLTASTIYKLGHIVKPTVNNGYYYICVKSGVTDIVEPTWVIGKVTSGTAIFKAVSYDLVLDELETLTASTWIANNQVKLTNPSFADGVTSVTIDKIPASIMSFTISNSIVKSNGEKLSYSFIYSVDPNSIITFVSGGMNFSSSGASGLIPIIS